ncbi:MAG TPA: hexose kinase [Solirubrobacteraceae bacterium]
MIVTVTLNAALDVTYEVERLVVDESHRVRSVAQRAGGKGINVARVLAGLGHDVTVTGLAGGATGELIRADLRAAGLPAALVDVAGDCRRTVTVVQREAPGATLFNEPGPLITPGEWDRLLRHLRALVADAAAVVLSGSLPPGVPLDAYALLVGLARDAGAPVVLDADGAALRAGVQAGPDVAKPNLAELRAATGLAELGRACAALRRAGARAVVASLGAAGLAADTAEGRWKAEPPLSVDGNPTGAGDAVVAALTAGLVAGRSWPERLADAVAVSAAAVHAPLAGDVDEAAYAAARERVRVVPW